MLEAPDYPPADWHILPNWGLDSTVWMLAVSSSPATASNFETFCGLTCSRSSGINGALVWVGAAALVCWKAVRIVVSVEVCWRVEDTLERVMVGLAPGMGEVVEVIVGLSSAKGEAAFSIPGWVVVGILSRLQAVVNDIAVDRKAARSMREIFIFQSL